MTEDVLFSRRGHVGIITLNRPKALNALSIAMMRRISEQLMLWYAEDTIQAVLLNHSAGKAFCAGGDVREVYSTAQASSLSEKTELIRVEYFLDNLIATYPKPVIALIDGLTFGGGAGISLHTPFTVATENTLFCMPEVRIGLFPDAGVDRLLCGLEGSFGVYLGLTGARLKAADMLACGLANYSISAERIPEILDRLYHTKSLCKAVIDDIFQNNGTATEEPEYTLEMRNWIAETFCFEKTGDIIKKVRADAANMALSLNIRDIAATTQQAMQLGSPLSLCLAHRILSHPPMTLTDTLQQNYTVGQNCLEYGDFYEGVRALLIDKDQNPNWKYDQVSSVEQSTIQSFFKPLLPALDWKLSTA